MIQFAINKAYFLQALHTTRRAISSKNAIPILSTIKIEVTSDGIYLTGSNGQISIENSISVSEENAGLLITQPGSILLEANFFINVISSLPDVTLTFEEIEQYQVLLKSGKSEITLKGKDVEQYPRIQEVDSLTPLLMDTKVLKSIIAETSFAASTQESRPILTGVHFILENQKLLAVATDSHRLSQRVIPTEQAVEDFNIVIPGKSLTELSRSLTNEEEMVEISIMENQVLFKTETMYFYSRLLEGNYPDTNRLIPTSHNTQIEFYVPELLSAIERASLLSHEGRNNIVRLSISPDSVVLYGNSPEIGKVEEALNYENVSGEALDISFNPDYMKDALRAFGDMNITVKFLSPIRPFTLEPTETELDFIQLITPVRTN